jgi:hypothetical protein
MKRLRRRLSSWRSLLCKNVIFKLDVDFFLFDLIWLKFGLVAKNVDEYMLALYIRLMRKDQDWFELCGIVSDDV